MHHYLKRGRGGREATGEWKGGEGGGNGGPGGGRAAGVRGAAAWCGRAGWRGRTQPRQTAGRRGRRRARRPGCLAALLGNAGRGGGYTRLCHATDQGAALPRQDRWRGRALPRQRSALLVTAMSAPCRAAMHDATQTFGRARTIGAAKSVSLKKTTVLDLKLVSKKC